MKKWLKSLIILVLIVALIVGGIFIYNTIKTNKELNAKYGVSPHFAQVSVNDMGLYISSSGNLTNANDVNVYTQAYGEVININVEEGEEVAKGDILATLNEETLLEDIEEIEEAIFQKELEISTGVFRDDIYYIKSPIAGEVKDIKIYQDDINTKNADEASDIGEALEEYGYLALISSDDLMYIVTEETANYLAIGTELTVSRRGNEYDAVVDKIEDGKTYILAQNDNMPIGSNVSIYQDDWSERVIGIAELYDYIEVSSPIEQGKVSRVYVSNNQTVEVGQKLFKITTRSQQMINLYQELEDLKTELEDKNQMLNNMQIVAPVDGIVEIINIQEEQNIEYEQLSFTLADTSTWLLPVLIDELDVNSIEVGMSALVTVDAYEDTTFAGEVIGISSVGTASGGVTSYEVMVEVENNNLFKLSMTANVEIGVQFVEQALTVPVEAIREINGQSFVVMYTNPTDDEVEKIKNNLIKAETMIAGKETIDIKQMSEEEIADLKAKSRKGDISEKKGELTGGIKGRTATDNDTTAETKGTLSPQAIATIELSIADKLYGKLVPVEVGLINESYAQILSGLSEGDNVLLPNSTSSTTEETGFGAMRFPGMGGGK